MSDEEKQEHQEKTKCNLCKTDFSNVNQEVTDHCHLSGKFRQTLCNTCNLKLQTPNFIPCFIHDLLNYDVHYIVTELGYNMKTISVIPNSEEKYISFLKYVTNDFSIHFIVSCQFMTSSLSVKNLIPSSNFEKFQETVEVFNKNEMKSSLAVR